MKSQPRQKSLSEMANEQINSGVQAHDRLAEGVSAAELPDCLTPSKGGSGLGGLFAIPAIAVAAATGKCKPPK
jgi:hypothetical protein